MGDSQRYFPLQEAAATLSDLVADDYPRVQIDWKPNGKGVVLRPVEDVPDKDNPLVQMFGIGWGDEKGTRDALVVYYGDAEMHGQFIVMEMDFTLIYEGIWVGGS